MVRAQTTKLAGAALVEKKRLDLKASDEAQPHLTLKMRVLKIQGSQFGYIKACHSRLHSELH